jgi:hypothetical protein
MASVRLLVRGKGPGLPNVVLVGDAEHVRRWILAVLASVVLTLPASAAGLDPQVLVLHQGDLPSGFLPDRQRTGLRTNEREARDYPVLRPKFREWGRVTGYQAEFDRGSASIAARVDVFRKDAGARRLLDFFDLEVRKGGVSGVKRSSVRIGTQARVYWTSPPVAFTVVAWSDGRVFAVVFAQGVTRTRVVGLARVQERQIAAALR